VAALLPLVYADLRKLAAARMARLGPGQTLQATALVHEAYIRLVGSKAQGWSSRNHFFGAAARAMRNVLADLLMGMNCVKRGGREWRVADDAAAEVGCDGPSDDLLALEQRLGELERDYPRQAEVVTMRFFGGLSTEAVADVLSLTTRTVERDWHFARAWLNSRLAGTEVDP
jgi:RNA polymerase sigma factor (TIGR02999 family)